MQNLEDIHPTEKLEIIVSIFYEYSNNYLSDDKQNLKKNNSTK